MYPIGAAPLFEEFIVDKAYTIRRRNPDGSISIIDNPKEKARILDTSFFEGSFACTIDRNHFTLIHKIIFIFQQIQGWLTGRLHKVDTNTCHFMIILSSGTKREDHLHPFRVAHAEFRGVITSDSDQIKDHEVTEMVFFRPVDAKLREIFKRQAEKTAFTLKAKHRTADSAKEKHPFSYSNMLFSAFYNKPHSACGKHGDITWRMKKRTAKLIADCLLNNQLLTNSGRPESFFCTSYAASVFQGSLYLRALDGFKPKDIERFQKDSKGTFLSRRALRKRICLCLSKKKINDPIAKTIQEVYNNSKLARFDTKFPMSSYMVQTLRDSSFIRQRNERLPCSA